MKSEDELPAAARPVIDAPGSMAGEKDSAAPKESGPTQASSLKPAAATSPRRRCIMVLGMHRSGTSALAKAINLLGADLPKHILPAGLGNESGHWEPERLVELNDKMLREAGSSWDDWRAFDPAGLGPERLNFYQSEIARIIDEEYGGSTLFVLKEPRLSRFVPLYSGILEAMNIDAIYLHVNRNPISVAASLEKRNSFTRGFSNIVWLRHEIDAEKSTRNSHRFFISYDDVILDWEKSIYSFTKIFNIEWPNCNNGRLPDLSQHFSMDLRHHSADPDMVDSDKDVSTWVGEAYRALLALVADRNDQKAMARLDTISCEFESVSSMFGDVFFSEIYARIKPFENDRDRLHQIATKLSQDICDAKEKQKKSDDKVLDLERNTKIIIDKMKKEISIIKKKHLKKISSYENKYLDLIKEKLILDSFIQRREELLKEKTQGFGFKIGEFVDSSIKSIKDLRLLFGNKISVRAAHDVLEIPEGAGLTKWRMTGVDPQFILLVPRSGSLPAGHYALSIHIPDGFGDIHRPRLYVDTGAGFNEKEAIDLRFPLNEEKYSTALFNLPAGARRLRFDPSDKPGELTFGKMRLRRLTRWQYLSAVVGRVSRRHLQNRRTMGRAMRHASNIFLSSGPKGLVAALRAAESRLDGNDYTSWAKLHDTISQSDAESIREQILKLPSTPLISVVMPVYNAPEALLRAAIESVRSQFYQNWQLCIADDASSLPHVRKILEEYAKLDHRIQVVFRPSNGHISAASNSALQLCKGDWVSFLDHDDALAPHALYCIADSIAKKPNIKLIYSDEDKIDEAGRRFDPYFKCDWNPDLFLSHNLITHLASYRSDLVKAVGGLRTDYNGAQDYDFALRCVEVLAPSEIHHIPHVLYHWRAVSGSTALTAAEKPYAMLAGEKALNQHFQRQAIKATAHVIGSGYRIDYELPEKPPLVSIIIPTRNGRDLVENCVNSIRRLTTYPNFEILLVDNDSDDPEALRFFKELEADGVARIIRDRRPFNYSALNNSAVRHAKGSILALLNNDIEVITPDWLSRMVALAIRPGTGAVGAKLLYPDGMVQHGGIIIGQGGVAGHAHLGFSRFAAGYANRAQLLSNFSAVTGACLVVSKENYVAVGGLNEEHLTVAFNDVDFCLKLTKLGLRNVWTPFAELYHHESISRGYETTPEKIARFQGEQNYMKDRWPALIAHDPAYSPNLTLEGGDFSFAFPPRVAKPWVESAA